MGMRLSLSVLPKTIAKQLWKMTDQDKFFDTVKTLEDIASDFCTDAMYYVLDKMQRVTKNKLSCECDIHIGKIDKDTFLIFINAVKEKAKKCGINAEFCGTSYFDLATPYGIENPLNFKGNVKSKWSITHGIDWISAYFNCLYIYKQFDWKNNYIYFEIG